MNLEDQIASVKREIGLREAMYPRWVSAGTLTKAKSEHEIAAMKAVLDTLEMLHEAKNTMSGAASLFREYEAHHREKGTDDGNRKANRNGAAAWLLEDRVRRLP